MIIDREKLITVMIAEKQKELDDLIARDAEVKAQINVFKNASVKTSFDNFELESLEEEALIYKALLKKFESICIDE